jgi:hypothetical protein
MAANHQEQTQIELADKIDALTGPLSDLPYLINQCPNRIPELEKWLNDGAKLVKLFLEVKA